MEGEVKNNQLVTTIKLEDNVQWEGEKRGDFWYNIPPLITNPANTARLQDSNLNFIDINNSNITIKNLIINGNRNNQREKNSSGNSCYTAINLKNIVDINISNIKIIHGLHDGIRIENGTNTTIKNSTFQNLGHSAVMLVQSSNSTINNNIIDVESNSGVRFFSGTDISIKDNYIFSSNDSGNYGIQISQAYSNGQVMDNVLIENNIIRHTPYAGIALYSSSPRDIAHAKIRNNIIYQCGAKAPNQGLFPNSEHQEAGGINIQAFKSIQILNNTLFNNRGSAIWLDNRFYIPDDTESAWNDLDNLDEMNKTAIINNNIIVGSQSESQEVYGIEKRVSNYIGISISSSNNVFYNNKNDAFSDNITADITDKLDTNPRFVDAPIYINIKDIFYRPEILNKEINFTLNNSEIIGIGASDTLIQKNNQFGQIYQELLK